MILVIINLLTSNNESHLKCVGGGWGLNVCVWLGGGGKFGTYSILHMFLSCNCAKMFYCISLQHSCEISFYGCFWFQWTDRFINRQKNMQTDMCPLTIVPGA